MIKLVVGLGNPGLEYKNNRHNIGFRIIDHYFKAIEGTTWIHNFDSLFYKTNNFILLKPMTYMNLSGRAIKSIVNYYKIEIENILIVYDDIAFPFSVMKVQQKINHNGHNGIKSIIQYLNNNDFFKLRVGISKNNIPLEKYVLSDFNNLEETKMPILLAKSKKIIDSFIEKGAIKTMDLFN